MEVARLATRQDGVVEREQLRTLGVADDAIDRRLESGRLHVMHRGVYAVGHRRVSRRGWWIAEVLACAIVHVLLEDFVVPAMYLFLAAEHMKEDSVEGRTDGTPQFVPASDNLEKR